MIHSVSTKMVPRALLLFGVFALFLALPAQGFAESHNPRTDPTAAQYENPVDEDPVDDPIEVDPETGGGDDGDSSPDDGDSSPIGGGGDYDNGDGSSIPVSTQGASTSELPFTGFDVGVMAVVALLLGATGFALRRMSAVR